MTDVLREFLVESGEHVADLDQALVNLERRPDSAPLLNSIFRTFHTLKGGCGILGLPRLERVAHAAEEVLAAIRAGSVPVSSPLVGDLLAALDVVRAILASLAAEGVEPPGDDAAVVARLDAWAAGRAAPTLALATDEVAPWEDAAQPRAAAPLPDEAPAAREVAAPEAATPDLAVQTLRVHVDVLDRLMNTVGELVLTRNQLATLAADDERSPYGASLQQLNRVTAELQLSVMKTRMQAVGGTWAKLPRLVRDVAEACGKQVQLELAGSETELDRQVLQAIQDPLLHLVRNAIDHGIERPETRRAAGKLPAGTLRLAARHEGGYVVLDVQDDGAGVDPDRVRASAVARGVARTEAIAAMDEEELAALLFTPGFSTAARATSVSGRGVGLDVVKANIERIGGSVELHSTRGAGCLVRIRIPLTLAIIPALLVAAEGEPLAIPQAAIVELVRLGDGGPRLERVHDATMLRLRDALLPIVPLATLLGAAAPDVAADGATPGDGVIVVCQHGVQRFGLHVAQVFDTQEIVVKPLGRHLRHVGLYTGCTILGDGRVAMILDAGGALAMSGLALRGERAAPRDDAATPAGAAAGDVSQWLLFRAGPVAQRAVALALVSRLEEIPTSAIEFADGRWVAQYRGTLLPLVPADPSMQVPAGEKRPVVVFRDGDRLMGLAVDEIVDIVEEAVQPGRAGGQPGVLATVIIGGRATEIVDAPYYLDQARPEWFAVGPRDRDARRRILVVDDSPFFLNVVTPVVRSWGYEVLTASSGLQALELLERGTRVDVMVCDLDMPDLDGYAVVQTLHADPRWESLPVVALTGLAGASTRERVLAAGFTHHVPKLDRAALLATLEDLDGRREVAA